MIKLAELETTLVGVAGEYYVAAELSLRGHLATVTLRNSRGIDIIASNSNASKTVSIQVKTTKGGKPSWILGKKTESFVSRKHYYVFVILKQQGARPDFYIVPSKIVAGQVATFHKNWLAGTKKDGTARRDSNIRVFRDHVDEYKESWELLNL